MPINRDDIEQGNSPITPPEGDIEEREMLTEPEPTPEPEPVPEPQSGSKWNWIGNPDRPEAQKVSDGISDLFEVPSDLTDTNDLVSVDIDRDIIDANEETGDLSDLVDVSEEDILGDEETGQVPLDYHPDYPPDMQQRPVARRPVRYTRRYPPDSSMRGMRY